MIFILAPFVLGCRSPGVSLISIFVYPSKKGGTHVLKKSRGLWSSLQNLTLCVIIPTSPQITMLSFGWTGASYTHNRAICVFFAIDRKYDVWFVGAYIGHWQRLLLLVGLDLCFFLCAPMSECHFFFEFTNSWAKSLRQYHIRVTMRWTPWGVTLQRFWLLRWLIMYFRVTFWFRGEGLL